MHLNWRRVAIHAVIVFALTIIGGFVVGMIAGLIGGPAPLMWLAVSNLVFASAGFAYSAYQTHEKRWAHIAAVALVLWLFSLINPLLGFASFLEWLLSLLAILVFMVVGGGVATLIEKYRSR